MKMNLNLNVKKKKETKNKPRLVLQSQAELFSLNAAHDQLRKFSQHYALKIPLDFLLFDWQAAKTRERWARQIVEQQQLFSFE